jgi:hypothetical protein
MTSTSSTVPTVQHGAAKATPPAVIKTAPPALQIQPPVALQPLSAPAFHVIAPFVSCAVFHGLPIKEGEKSPLELAIEANYKEIYVISEGGIFKHHILSPGQNGMKRFVQVKVTAVPGLKMLDAPKPTYNFLPAGKIPTPIFDQIIGFFKSVMKLHGRSLEAMAFVMWTVEQGYFVHIPEQTVSQASVKYDPATLPAGIIVLDIHSHNDMGAFFSGTDNGDDLHTIRFSAVAGHLSRPTPETIWRFNFGSTKYEMKMEDVFEEPARPEVDVPADWIGNIKTYTPPANYKYQGALAQGGGRSNGQDFRVGQGSQGSAVGDQHPRTGSVHGGEQWESGKGAAGQSWGPGAHRPPQQQRTWPFQGAAGAVGAGTRAEQAAGVGFGFGSDHSTKPTPYPTTPGFIVDAQGNAMRADVAKAGGDTAVTERPPALHSVQRSFTVVPSGTGASGGATAGPNAAAAPGINTAKNYNGSSPAMQLADGTWTSDLDAAWAEYETMLGMGGGPVGDNATVQVKAQTPSQLRAELAMQAASRGVIAKTAGTLNPTMSASEYEDEGADPFLGMEGTVEIRGAWVAPFDSAQAEAGDNDFGDPVGNGSDAYHAEDIESDIEIIQRMRTAQGADEFGVGENGYGEVGIGPDFEESTGVTAEEIAHHPRFDELMIMNGAEVATAFCFIDAMMGSLSNEDELLADLLVDMFMLMSEDKRVAAFRGLFTALPQESQESIETHGL